MKKKVIIISVVSAICVVGMIICFILYGNKIKGDKNKQTQPIAFDDKNYNTKMFKTAYNSSDGNFLVSPYSIYVALSMLRDGGNNNTSAEISRLIGTDKAKLLDNESVHIANAIFLKDSYKNYVENNYIDGLKNNYKAELLLDRFDTPEVINNWVKKETSDMIEKVMDEIDKDFVIGLANAIAIDVKWQYQFMCDRTVSEEFTQKDNSKMNVEMMHQSFEGAAEYIESDKAKGIILPYEEETNLEYVAILPNDGIDDYVNNFTMDELNKLEENKKKAGSALHINLSLPRYSYEFELKSFAKNLGDLGIKDIFNPEKADFTNIMTKDNMKKSGVGNLYVSQAIHKTFVDLNEAGTKAAAVTFFGLSKATSIKPERFETIDIKFNKPFMYLIRDKKSGEALFMGVVQKPNEWKGTTCEKEE